jgi:hypothetical protein
VNREVRKHRDAALVSDRNRRLRTLLALCLSLSCVDLWTKLLIPTPEWALHQRSLLWAIGCAVLLAGLFPLSRLPSNAVIFGAGLLSGGVLGNLISAGFDHLEVPNPLLLTTAHGGVAFNAADTFILGGNLVLIVALCDLLLRHRDRLPKHAFFRTRR